MPDRPMDRADLERNRRPSGQFGNKPHSDPGEVPVSTVGVATILQADSNTLWGYVDSGDPELQIPASWSAALTTEQAVALSGPDQPVETRMAMARSIFGEAHQVTAEDPDPLVRYLTLRDAPGLEPATRDRLRGDEQVQAVDAAMTAGALA